MSEARIAERIKELEEELRTTKYNKRTEHAVGLLKVKIAHLKEELEQQKQTRKQAKKLSYAVKKEGDATVVLIGFPSVGKSTLLNKLTNAESKVASYDFTTIDCIPGIMEYNSAKIQILDLPGIISGAAAGTGRGKEALSVIRSADMVLVLADVYSAEKEINVTIKELFDTGIRMNQKQPEIKLLKRAKGGITISSTVKLTKLSHQQIIDILKEFRILNAELIIREDIDEEQLIDTINGNRVYIPALFVLNKIDLLSAEDLNNLRERMKLLLNKTISKKDFRDKTAEEINFVMISAEKGQNLEIVKETIFKKLRLIRIYLKRMGREADLNEPMIVKKDATIYDVCKKIHNDFVNRFRFARVWGSSAKFPGQKFSLSHVLKDKDIVQLYLR